MNRRGRAQRLQHHAVALGELDQLFSLLGRGVGFEVEMQPDFAEPDRSVLRDAERAAEVEIPRGGYVRIFQINSQRGGTRLQRDPGAGDERLEQHVARAGLRAASPGRWRSEEHTSELQSRFGSSYAALL